MSLDRALPELPKKTEDELRKERSVLRLKEMDREGSRWFDPSYKLTRDMNEYVASMKNGNISSQNLFLRIQECEDLINGLDRNDRQFERNWGRMVDRQRSMIKELEERMHYAGDSPLPNGMSNKEGHDVIEALLIKAREYAQPKGSEGMSDDTEGDARRIDSV